MIRVRDSSSTGSSTRTQKIYNADGVLTSTVPETYTWSNRDRMEDTVTPQFQRKSQNGEIIISPMSKWKTSAEITQRSFTQFDPIVSGKRSRVEFSALWAPIENRPSNWTDTTPADNAWTAIMTEVQRLEALAITDSYAGVGQPDVSALVSVGELPETLAFLWGPVSEMLKLTKRGRRWLHGARERDERFAEQKRRFNSLPPDKRKGKKPPEKQPNPPFVVGKWSATDISSFWLAYRYGLMPLIYEFQDWQKALQESLKKQTRETSRATQSTTKEITTREYVHNSGALQTRITEKVNFKVTARAGVLYTPSAEWTTRFGIQLNRVPAAAYEMIPLSFVADWFWNGASVYDALTAEFRAQKILGAWVATTVSYTFEVDRTFVQFTSPGYASSGTGGVCFTENGDVKMRHSTSLGDIRVKLRIELNAKRIADGLALIHTFISGRGK